jgi:hypothetical protein
MTLPHSTQLTLPAFCSSTGTQYEIMRLCVQAHGGLTSSGCWACVDSLKFTLHLRLTVGFRFRLVRRGYSRCVVEALSTKTGLSCRIDNRALSWFVRQSEERCCMFSGEVAEDRDQDSHVWQAHTGLFPFTSASRTFTPRAPAGLRSGPAPHSFSCASFRESLHGKC